MAFLCFFCKETDVIEWHDVEDGFEPYQPPRRSCRASASSSGRQGSRDYSSSPSYRIIAETVDEPEARGTYNPPKPPLNKRARSGTSKGVRFVKVDIRVPRQEGRGTKKVVRLVKIDIRPRPDGGGNGRRQEFDPGFVSSAHEGWPFRQSRPGPSTRGEIQEGSESPEIGFFNSPNRERAAKILRGGRGYQQELRQGMDFGFLGSSPSSGRGLKQRPARPRQEIFECDAPKDVFVGSPSNKSPRKVWPSSHRRNRPRNEIFHGPSGSNRSGGSGGLQSPNRPDHETLGRDTWHRGAIRGLQSPHRLEKETSERPVSHGWAIRGLESPNRVVPRTYGRAMSHSGAMRGLLSSNSPVEETYDRARSGSGSVKGLQSPNRTVQEVYERAMSHSGAIRSLESPNRNLHEFDERAMNPSGEVGSSQSPNRDLQEVRARPLSHSGAIRCLESPSRSPGGGYRSPHSANRSRQDSGAFTSPSPDAWSRHNSPGVGWDSNQRSNLYRRSHGESGEIKLAEG